MRPRFRSRSGPNAPRDGSPLELVRVRGPQRDTGHDGHNLERGARRSRRRGGRGRGPRPPAPAGFSLVGWLKGLFGAPKRPAPAPARGRGRGYGTELGDQESRALADFGRQYGITFRDPGLLKLALTHRSYLHVTGQGPRESNERLEFLGDSVLGLVTSEYLYRSHPGEHEGQLTKTKSLLVSKAILSRRALAMGLGRFVLMSHSEVESGGRQRLSILADAFESVIGAIYLDQGFEAARAFIERWLLKESRVIAADKRHTNYKSHLQEYVQSTFRTHPVYRIRSEVGPDHSKQFMVEVMVGRRVLGQGRGRNKKEAEQAAARSALEAVENGPMSDREARRVERQAPRATSSETERGTARPAVDERTAPGAESFEEGSEGDRRRRRGRRGGRGRRPREEGPGGTRGVGSPPAASAPPGRGDVAPEAPRARGASPIMARTRVPAPMPPTPPPLPRPAELEPVPPAYEEDENEEVGRPEGPHDERRVDPFAWDVPSASDLEGAPSGPEPERPYAGAASSSIPARRGDAEAEGATPMMAEPHEVAGSAGVELRDEESEAPEVAPVIPSESELRGDDEDAGPRYPETDLPATPPAGPTWGRRSRRSR